MVLLPQEPKRVVRGGVRLTLMSQALLKGISVSMKKLLLKNRERSAMLYGALSKVEL